MRQICVIILSSSVSEMPRLHNIHASKCLHSRSQKMLKNACDIHVYHRARCTTTLVPETRTVRCEYASSFRERWGLRGYCRTADTRIACISNG